MIHDILLTIIAILFGIISPYLYDRFISPLTIKDKISDISGNYHSLAYILDTKTHDNIAHEKLLIKQVGTKIKIKVISTDVNYLYEFCGELKNNFVHGHWKSISPDNDYCGVATFYFTKEKDLFGIWMGDTQTVKVGWGFWLISKNKEKLNKIKINIDENFNQVVKDFNDLLISKK